MADSKILFWVGFHLFIAILLFLDLAVFHKKPRAILLKEGIIWSCVWISISLLFNLLIYFVLGPTQALQFFTGYLIEKSLSVDNIFVFLVIFSYFKVASAEQHRILYWGIIGALIMRLTFILGGVVLIQKFHWILYLFGAFLCVTGIKFAFEKETRKEGFVAVLAHWLSKHLKLSRFFLVLIVIELTDLIFAFDSIPAVFAITTDPFLVYTSNVFAILGLRSLHHVLSASMKHFRFLKVGLGALLVFVGIKMLIAPIYSLPTGVALVFVISILAVTFCIDRLKSR